jgi:hypothetical protein
MKQYKIMRYIIFAIMFYNLRDRIGSDQTVA